MKALEKQIEDEHGVYPCMAWDNNYRELELEELKKIVSEEEARKMQERAAKFADKEIRRKTYQAMEALIRNLNTCLLYTSWNIYLLIVYIFINIETD